MVELMFQLRGAAIKQVMLNSLNWYEQEWLNDHYDDDDLEHASAVEIWMRMNAVTDAQAIIDLARRCNLIEKQTHEQLKRELGV